MKTKNQLSRNLAKMLLVAVLFSFTSCETTGKKTTINEQYNGSNITIIEIDSCEYIYVNLDYKSLTHKGNCKFCLARRHAE